MHILPHIEGARGHAALVGQHYRSIGLHQSVAALGPALRAARVDPAAILKEG
jgi:hypothetical protein